MPLLKYGVLKGTVVGHERNADDDHYQVMVRAGNTLHRIAVNVRSKATNAPSTLLFQTKVALPDGLKTNLRALPAGYKKLPSKAGGLADPASMTPVPPDIPGEDNDLKDMVEKAVLRAMTEEGSVVYAFGEKWGPEATKKDKYFGFLPGNGIHDIHMNQGNDGSWRKDNGIFQDGALIFEFPQDKWRLLFFTFQSQTFDTDEKGNPRTGAPPAKKAAKKTASKKKKKRN